MTSQQYDLFGWDAAQEYDRYRDALTVLADAHPNALELLIGVRIADRAVIKQGVSGPWAYQVRGDGLYTEPRTEWAGWGTRPRNRVTWAELDALTADDSRIWEVRAWSESLTVIDAWRDRGRPFELWPYPESWNPHYIAADHARPGWDARLHAWLQTVQVYRDALTRLDPQGT